MDFIADLLSRLRDRKITQLEISRETGIPQPRLSDWSRETPEPNLDVLRLVEFAKKRGVEGRPRLLKQRRPRPTRKSSV